MTTPSPIELARLRETGRRCFPGFRLEVVARIPSTQDRVRSACAAGAADGFCCVAMEQTAGRGRQGRRWTAPAQTALLTSIAVRCPAITLVPLAAGLAICDSVAALGTEARLKWPNDVLADDRKLAGVLCERIHGDLIVVGMGINLAIETFPPDIAGTSLVALTGRAPAWHEMLGELLPPLRARLETAVTDPERLLEAWRERAVGLGSAVAVAAGETTIAGIAADVTASGALLIETADGPVEVVAGDVHMLRPGH